MPRPVVRVWRLANLEADAAQVQAYVRNATIDADGTLTVSATADETINAIVFAGSVAIAGGSTGVGAPQFFPYCPLQLVGLMAALKGAAEYETLIGRPGLGTRGMPAQQ